MSLNSLRSYSAVRPSGIEWLGDVPEHWDIRAVKSSFHIQLGKMLQTIPRTPDDLEVSYLKAAHVQWLSIQAADPPTMWANSREVEQFGIRVGDLLVCEGGEGGRSGIVRTNVDGYIIQNALHRIRPKAQGSNLYLQYVMYVAMASGWFDVINNKATIAHFTREKLAAFQTPLPPLFEQRAIVRYLGYADRRIRRYVRAKERLIGLLEEEKQAIINQAVTRGLDPRVRVRSSGVEWLGDVPEHWEVRRLKQASVVQAGVTLGKNYGDRKLFERPYLRVANVQSGHLDLSKVTTVRVPASEIQRSTLRVGDVLMTEGGDIDKLGRGCVWSGEIKDCLHQNHVFAVRTDRRVLLPEFLVAVMESSHGRSYFQSRAKRTTNLAATNQTTLGNLPLVMPRIDEQAKILDSIRRRCGRQDAAIARARRQVELVEEYRTRLIADVVTGKLDVRETAAGLADEADGELGDGEGLG